MQRQSDDLGDLLLGDRRLAATPCADFTEPGEALHGATLPPRPDRVHRQFEGLGDATLLDPARGQQQHLITNVRVAFAAKRASTTVQCDLFHPMGYRDEARNLPIFLVGGGYEDTADLTLAGLRIYKRVHLADWMPAPNGRAGISPAAERRRPALQERPHPVTRVLGGQHHLLYPGLLDQRRPPVRVQRPVDQPLGQPDRFRRPGHQPL